ncbi:MAG: hypothetical protein ACTSYC_09845 [Promethearchaeota archaeon]
MKINESMLALLYTPGIFFYFMNLTIVTLISFIFLQLPIILVMIRGKIKNIIEEQIKIKLEKEKKDILIHSEAWRGQLKILESNQDHFYILLKSLID